jgi:hypothetical protein
MNFYYERRQKAGAKKPTIPPKPIVLTSGIILAAVSTEFLVGVTFAAISTPSAFGYQKKRSQDR